MFTVAIDGPAAAGKGTIARAIAARFGFSHLDTGLLYRAVAMKGGDPLLAAQTLVEADLSHPGLRSLEAGRAASIVAAMPQVRAALTDFQRAFARRPEGAVLDGRDIGTVICPGAQVKLYITASAHVRAHRRWVELGGEASGRALDAVEREVEDRDQRDMGRADAPLRPAADAVIMDTTDLAVAEALAQACALIEARLTPRA